MTQKFHYPRVLLCLGVALTGVCTVHAAPLSREVVIAKLQDKNVNVSDLTIPATRGGAMLSLGIGTKGGGANNANDETLALVSQLPEIRRLFIHEGTFTRAGLAKLAALTDLQSLAFHAPKVEPAVFAALAELPHLQGLRFSEYALTDEVLAAAGTIRGLKKLEVGSFINRSQRVSAEGIGQFLASVESLESLVFLGTPVDDAALVRLGKMTNLERLWLDSRQITPKAWSHLAALTGMHDLYFRGTNFNDDGAHALAGMKELEILMLDDTAITDAGLESLAGLVNLADLGLANTKVTDAGIKHLAGMKKLHNLYVVGTAVTAKGLAILPAKREMAMMRIGQRPSTAAEFLELEQLFPRSEIFDTAGYWTPERARAARQQQPTNRAGPKK